MKYQLLSSGKMNTKIGKNKNDNFLIFSLNLKPAEIEIDGKIKDVCPWRTKGCTLACVGTNGHFQMKNGSAYKAQVRRTTMFFKERNEFLTILLEEMYYARKQAKRKDATAVFRLNAYSDINWERITTSYLNKYGLYGEGTSFYDIFSDCLFYDYTKDRKKALTNTVENYSLVYSHHEETSLKDSLELVENGQNVSIIFEEIPETFHGMPVFNGDKDDNRFLDPKGHIIGLKFKGNKKKLLQAIADGFCIPKIQNI